MCNTRLNLYEKNPSGMNEYLSMYGWHFSKKMCQWAVSMMTDRNGAPLKLMTKEEADELLKRYGIKITNDKGYDVPYVVAMKKSDCWGSSIKDDMVLALAVKDYLDDKDGYEGLALTRFVADCDGSGTPIIWEDMI